MYTEGSLFDGRYLLKERKGRGSFGEVWRAIDTQVDVEFAVKIYVAMDSRGLDDFKKEYQLSCNLINSNLLHINRMDICQEDSCPYLVMPYCPNGASSLIGRLSESEIWAFIRDVSNGLAYLHDQEPPIIHQDIKPENILQTKEGSYVITDFGISKQLRGTVRSTSDDSRGAVAYMGPERFQRGYKTIKASDIWSLGVSIYELATGQLPFEGKGGNVLNYGAEIPDLPNFYSEKLNDICKLCLCGNTWERPTAHDLYNIAIEQINNPFAENGKRDENSSYIKSKNKTPYVSRLLIAACSILIFVLLSYIVKTLFFTDSPVHNVEANSIQETVELPKPKQTITIGTNSSSDKDKFEPNIQNIEFEEELNPIESEKVVEVVTNGTINLGYAVWNGQIKSGKPNGKGKMSFIEDYELQGHLIKAGDEIEGSCSNGDLEGFCTWFSKEGKKSIMLGS